MQQEPKVTVELALEHGLTEEEYAKIQEILGRVPTFTELGVFSVMWSEHCSYKNSILELKKLPRSGGRLLVAAGEENAGLVDIGDGLAVCFKIESHNHPSAIEPYQGATTGVGGIMRDIFTMGARPVAALNSLRFGLLNNPRNRYLFDGVVRGIADYGNCLGVPTVSGEVYFEDCYTDNPLVNAMTVGVVDVNKTASAIAKGEGNAVYIIGSRTGRDGIHGATFASEEISEESEEKRPSVQVGDPFTEKLLLEATLEMIDKDLLVGIQDMGAAGISCSTSEMSAKGESGMIIDLDKVPLREKEMSAYEILLSESQERMLAVAKKGKENEIEAICDKWDLICEQVGHVTDEPVLKFYQHGELKAEIPPYHLVLGGGAPVYQREAKPPKYIDELQNYDFSGLDFESLDLQTALEQIMNSLNIVSKRWVYEQYDHMVQTNTVVYPGGDAGVVRIKGTNKGIAMKTDGNGRYVYLNPNKGGKIAVAEAARNVVATGGIPLAITNCLNFGNPYKPEMFWQFKEAVAGMGEACRVFDTPVTGGNVSFYNESPTRAVYPTPVIGMVGLVEDISKVMTANFKDEGDLIFLLGETKEEIGGSEFLKVMFDTVAGDIPDIDLELEKKHHKFVLDAINENVVKSVHDVADGGLAVALVESCIADKNNVKGAAIHLPETLAPYFWLFSETQGRYLISVDPNHVSEFKKLVNSYGVECIQIGKVGGNLLQINNWIKMDVEKLANNYYNTIQVTMEGQ
ncbi:MAG: phosphoribosylformylglycinamidine synthase subunit PurL [Calditrichia bacterium]